MALEFALVFLELDVPVLELVQILLKGSDASLGLVEVILVPSFHGFDIAGSLDHVGFKFLDFALEGLIGVSDSRQIGEDAISLALDSLQKLA